MNERIVNQHSLTPEEDARLSNLKATLGNATLEPDAADEKNIVKSVRGNEPEVGDLSGAMDRQGQQSIEHDKNRQMELMEQVRSQFRVAGSRFHFKDQPQKVAFKDKGESMVSASNDERVAKAMATMAEAKGWKTIEVSGHPDFKREVWMEATLRGLDVRGFKPKEQDLSLLEAKRERSMYNTVIHVETGREQMKDIQSPESGERNPAQHSERESKKALRTYEGRVLEHGLANFKHDPDEKPSYFVKLATDKGEKTVWGIDLKRAMAEGSVKNGDDIKMEFKGNEPVTVEALIRNKAGKIVGKEEITTHRNTWDVQKSDKARVVESVASAFIDSNVKDPAQREALKAAVGERVAMREHLNKVPAVPVYDKSAPAKIQEERTRPVIERTAERTR
jgi:putative DNA primase/helicase